MENKNKIKVGTGIFTYKEKCKDCGELKLVDINGFCKDCYIGNIEEKIEKQESEEDRTEGFCDNLLDMEVTKNEALGIINFLIGYFDLNIDEVDFEK